MKATAIVKCYYPEREPNLTPILDSIVQVPDIEKIIIWINGPAYTPRGQWTKTPLEIMTATGNHMMGHYAAALLAPTSLIYYQDDDLIVHPETITRLIQAASRNAVDMHGILGRNFAKDAALPYAGGRAVAEGQADMILGRAWAAHRKALLSGMLRVFQEDIDPGRAEDMCFSFRRASVVGNCHWTDIPENGIGLCHEAEHKGEREAWARYLLGSGPRPG